MIMLMDFGGRRFNGSATIPGDGAGCSQCHFTVLDGAHLARCRFAPAHHCRRQSGMVSGIARITGMLEQ